MSEKDMENISRIFQVGNRGLLANDIKIAILAILSIIAFGVIFFVAGVVAISIIGFFVFCIGIYMIYSLIKNLLFKRKSSAQTQKFTYTIKEEINRNYDD